LSIGCAEASDKHDVFVKKFHDYQRKAEMYYVYHSIQRFTVYTTVIVCHLFSLGVLGLWKVYSEKWFLSVWK